MCAHVEGKQLFGLVRGANTMSMRSEGFGWVLTYLLFCSFTYLLTKNMIFANEYLFSLYYSELN